MEVSGIEESDQLTEKLLGKNGANDDEVPLLDDSSSVDQNNEEEWENLSLGRKILDENKKLWMVAGPSIITRFSTVGMTVISQAFIGHIGSTELAAYALVSTVLMRFANGILLGMASALKTLCGQSYGAKQYHMLSIYLQRFWIILTVAAICLLPIYIFTGPVLRFLGQDAEMAKMAGVISAWFIPVMLSYTCTFTLQMYLQAQSRNVIITYLAMLTLGLHLFLSWFMTIKLNLGVAGVMGSMIVAMWVPVFGQLAFVFCGGCPETWTGFSWEAFSDLTTVVKLSISSGVMRCLELWYNTVLVLLTRYMKNAEVTKDDALSICLNINGWEMMISVSFLAAAGVRVANELGAGNARRAKFAIKNVVLNSFAIGSTLFVFFLLFTEDSNVAKAVLHLSPLLAFSVLLNSVQPVLSGVAVGAGWQSVVAYVNITCYYLIGIPLGALLGYGFKYHVEGIWVGMLLGTLVQTTVLLIITTRTDWNKQVIIAKERLNKWNLDEEGASNDSSNCFDDCTS